MENKDTMEEVSQTVEKLYDGCVTREREFVVLDSGKREEFSTGAKRDTQNDKPRFDLLPVPALLRVAELYRKGAVKYGEGNWTKGMPFSRVYASLLRHLYAFILGETTEDHLSAVVFNTFCLMTFQDAIKAGRLPAELDDITGKNGIL